MSFGFATPWLLVGLAAALVPLLVHLLRRRPPRPTPFPAFVLLLRPERRHARRRRLRQWLLLAVRMLLLAAVAVALAGPYCTRPVDVPPTASRHQAAVIVLDDSLSMRYRVGERTLFERARARAGSLLSVLPPTAPVGLITVTGQGLQVRELSLDRARLRRVLSATRPTWQRGDGASALARAVQLLSSARRGTPRAIYLLTDLTRQGVRLPEGGLPPEVALQVLDMAQRGLPNRAVVGVEIASTAGRGSAISVPVTVRNAGPEPRRLEVQLRAAGREVARQTVAVSAYASSRIPLKVAAKRIPTGARFLVARVAGQDGLPVDDERLVPLGAARRLRVLLVDGDPRETRHDDELFYLESALHALLDHRRLRVQVVAAEDLEGLALAGQDLVVLANVGRVTRHTVKRLRRFVSRGGALFLSVGDQVDPEAYNQMLGRLLPGTLRSYRTGGAAGPSGPPARLALLDAAPVIQACLDDPASRRALLAASVRRYALLGAVRGPVLLRLQSGAPLLVSRTLGAGRVLLMTTTVDRAWTDLVHRPAFLPLLEGILRLLTGHGERSSTSQVRVGRPALLRVQPGEVLFVRPPSGPLQRLPPAGPDGTAVFVHTDQPGAYRVYSLGAGRADHTDPNRGKSPPVRTRTLANAGAAGLPGLVGMHERPGLAFAVVTDPAESDLRRLDRPPNQVGQLGSGSGPAPRATVRQDLVTLFALLCLLLLFAETLLAARFGRWRRRA